MNKLNYIPIVKSSDAELKSISNLSDETKERITPLFELTRSRKTDKLKEGDIYRRLLSLKDLIGDREFILDLTTDPNSINSQIENLRDSENGYEGWTDFLIDLKEDFPGLIPVLQVSDEGVDNKAEFYKRIRTQVQNLKDSFPYLVYRFPIEYEYYEEDLGHVLKETKAANLLPILDAGFISQGKASMYAEKAKVIVDQLSKNSLNKIVLSATSFPQNPIEFGDDENGEYELEETTFYQNVKKQVSTSLIYSDYATINPIRVDRAGGNGWVPRMDIPTEKEIFYYRSRRTKLESTYTKAYIRVARNVLADDRYKKMKKKIGDCWAIEQIELAAEGYPPGLSPGFWIAVRMNLHMSIKRG